jgi:CheY-like chemotaxis protein
MALLKFFYLDNNRIAQKRLQNMFSTMANVEQVLSYQEAVQLINDQPDFDAFFIDHQLKHKSGIQFACYIRSILKYDAKPVFLLAPVINEMLAYLSLIHI